MELIRNGMSGLKISEETHTFVHIYIKHLQSDDYLRLKDEKDFWVLHLNHDDGIQIDLSVAYTESGRKWLIEKGYTPHFVHETLEKLSNHDWVLFTEQGENVDGLEVYEWL
jgi:hypothetical protein